MRAAFAEHRGSRVMEREGRTVGAVAGKGIEDIRDRHDAAGEWNAFPTQPLRIAAPVKPFVMRKRDLACKSKDRTLRLGEDCVADDAVASDDQLLLVCQESGLQENAVRHRDLADIV
jgi:hypothetical protein